MKEQLITSAKKVGDVAKAVAHHELTKKFSLGVVRELLRGIALIAVLVYMWRVDTTGFSVVKYMISFLLLIALTSHYIRRIMFPKIDMAKIADKAMETPAGAAAVFIGLCMIIVACIVAGAQFLK